ncbi:MAG: protein-disulfide reductase DsbD domain-containing protein [Chlamydiota bacterium]|nr:protein-disulfide reductase DsbD domain-containing protein [Chlamydiota bacterium]
MFRLIKNKLFASCFLAITLVLSSISTLHSEGIGPQQEASLHPPISAELFVEHDAIQPGQPFTVAIKLNIEDQWHAYWKNPGEVGMPISIDWNLPSGFTASTIEWPTPIRFDTESIIGFGYEHEAVLLTEITPPEQLPLSSSTTIAASINWLACSDSSCLPGATDVEISLPVNDAPSITNLGSTIISDAKSHLPKDNWADLCASRKQNLLEIVLKTPENTAIPSKATFFPENPDLIDVQSLTTITPCDKDTYVIALKENDDAETKPSSIKGVLVLESSDGKGIIEAINIDKTLDGSTFNSSVVSMNATDHQESDHKTMLLQPTDQQPSSPFESGFLFYLITAFIGGVILNLMPCVLPVISLKIMSFVKLSGENRSKTLFHGITFALGVLASFWVLAGILMTLQSYGHAVGWGFQLQQPIVIAILTVIILVFGMSMFGVFEMGTSVASWAGQKQADTQKNSDSALSSFFSGVLATAMATPCTGPFLGPAIGFAVTQPPLWSLLIFTSLGLGMAAPYLLLSAFPSLLRYMPKPGNWMITFREITGFIMLTVVLWLLWVFGAQTDSIALFLLMASLLLFAVGCWIYGKWSSPIRSKRVRILGIVFTLLCFLAGGNIAYNAVSQPITTLDDKQPISLGDHHRTMAWKKFNSEKVQALQEEGTPVFIDFTAKWCLICQANHLVLSADKVDAKLQELGVVKMKADWTKYDPALTEELKKHGRNGVPLYLLYSGIPNKPPEVLPQVLTPDLVLEYLNEIEKNKVIGQNTNAS